MAQYTQKDKKASQVHNKSHTKKNLRKKSGSVQCVIPAERGIRGWRTWRRIFYDLHTSTHPVHILEIGCYQGEATSWFLRNLCHHPKSKVHAVDTFAGSPEYITTNFSKIEQTFWRNVRATGRESQVEMHKSMSYDVLVEMNNARKHPFLDVVFVDASHESHDVIADGILSFALLKIGGIMVFDDYEWDKLVQSYYRPKLAIDSFLSIMQPQIQILAKRSQVILRKTSRSDAPLSQEKLHQTLRSFYTAFATDTIVSLRSTPHGKPIRAINWKVYHGKHPMHDAHCIDDATKVRSHPYIVPEAFISVVRDIYSHTFVQSQYNRLNTHYRNHSSIQLFQSIGLKPWHRSYFWQYMHLLQHWSANRRQSISTPQPNVLNFRYSRDFSGKFWSQSSCVNYMNPAKSFRVKPKYFYDVSCTTDYEHFGNRNLDSTESQRRYFNFVSNQLNLWSLDNWVSLLKYLAQKIDIMVVSCMIPYHQLNPSSCELPCALRVYLRNVHTFVVSAFALLVQREGGVVCLTLHENTLHTTFMQHVVHLLSSCYRDVKFVYSHCNGVSRRLQLLAYGFNASKLTAQARLNLVQQMKEQASVFKPYSSRTRDFFSTLALNRGLYSCRLPAQFTSRLRCIVSTLTKSEERWKSYLSFIVNIADTLPTSSLPELYNALVEHQTKLYLQWCDQNYKVYKTLSH